MLGIAISVAQSNERRSQTYFGNVQMLIDETSVENLAPLEHDLWELT